MNNTLLINQAIANSDLDKSIAYHTYKEWKNKGYQVQKGQKAVLSVQLWKKIGNRFVQAPSYLFSENQVEEIGKNLAKTLKGILDDPDEKLEKIDEPEVEPEAPEVEQEVISFELPEVPKKKRVSKKEATIARILKKCLNERLKAIHKKGDTIEVTDGYQAYFLKDFENSLPTTEDFPDLSKLVPSTEPKQKLVLSAEFVRNLYKTAKKLKGKIENINYKYLEHDKYHAFKIGETWVSLEYLVNAIDILEYDKQQDYVYVDTYGEVKPIVIKKDGEIALISPIRIEHYERKQHK